MTNQLSAPQPAYSKTKDSSGNRVRLVKDGKLGWRCRVYDVKTGRQPETTFYGTEREARRFIEQRREQVRAATVPTLPDARYVTVRQWALHFLRRYQWTRPPVGDDPGVARKRSTWKNAKNNVSAYVVPRLGEDTRLVTITYDQLYSAVGTLKVTDHSKPDKPKTKPADADTKEKFASILRIMFKAAVDEGVLPSSPAARLPTKWGERSRERRVVIPSLRQLEDLAAAMDADWPGHGDLVRVFGYTGLRWENMATVRLSEVDLKRRSIHVWRSAPAGSPARYEEEGTKGGDDYYITIIDEAVEPLCRLMALAEKRGSEHLMCGVRGGPLNYSLWRKHLAKAQEASKVPYTAHALRHVCASIMIAGGASVDEVADQLAHKSTNVTRRVYRHAFNMDRRELAARLSAAVTGLWAEEGVEAPAA